MPLKSCLAAMSVSLGLVLGPTQAAAMECPAKSTQMDDIIASLNAAGGCDAAMKVFEACEYGTSGDTQFGEVVQKKCEADFLDKGKASMTQAYRRELGVCDRKYRNKPGSMYVSAAAFCRAKIAQRYSQRMRKASGAK